MKLLSDAKFIKRKRYNSYKCVHFISFDLTVLHASFRECKSSVNCVVGVFSARLFVSLLAQQIVRLHSRGGGGGRALTFLL